MTYKPPDAAGKIVGIVEFEGRILVACQFGVFRLGDTRFEPIMFVEPQEGMISTNERLKLVNIAPKPDQSNLYGKETDET